MVHLRAAYDFLSSDQGNFNLIISYNSSNNYDDDIEYPVPFINEGGSEERLHSASVPRLANMVYIALLNWEKYNKFSLFRKPSLTFFYLCLLVLYKFVNSHSHVILDSSLYRHCLCKLFLKSNYLWYPFIIILLEQLMRTGLSPLFCTS